MGDEIFCVRAGHWKYFNKNLLKLFKKIKDGI
jgi:hypothetical protein